MHKDTYTIVLKSLRALDKQIVAAQLARARTDSALAAELEAEWREAEVGGRLDAWIEVAARRSTVRFLLRTVYVRVLEDLGALVLPLAPEGAGRLRGYWGLEAFREVAPGLGLRAYLGFVFRDLAVAFPDVFAPADDELPLPDEVCCKAVWDAWHDPAGLGGLRFDGAPEEGAPAAAGFDSRFLGDLYQDLDADVRKRFALLQTPPFVEAFILDRTLTPALAVFDPAALREQDLCFRVLDPTCGSGHFLLGAWRRLFAWWQARGCEPWEAATRAADSVWGADINPHAVDIARFRLLLEVMARTGVRDLGRLRELPAHLEVMDSLIPWEGQAQTELFAGADLLASYATPAERDRHQTFLDRDFHVVVGNPPYITPKDVKKREDYRRFWPDSCHMRYALSAPFVERLFVLGCDGAFMGQITANSFMKRGFGEKLITQVFRKWDLTGVVDSSGAYIPGHGTPTVILFGRCQPPVAAEVWSILGKRGEPSRPSNPARGLVWSAIAQAGSEPDDTNSFVTVALMPRATLHTHPWSLGGGEAAPLLSDLVASASTTLEQRARVGMMTILNLDEVYVPAPTWVVRSMPDHIARMVTGTDVRDFSITEEPAVLFPYDRTARVPAVWPRSAAAFQHLWLWRFLLWNRNSVGLRKVRDRGMLFYEFPFHYPDAYVGLGITFAEVATHGHFVLDRGGKVFKQTAPVIKLPPGASLEDHLDILGLMSSSALEFWGKQTFHCKGYGADNSGARTTADEWENFYQRDSTKLQTAPFTTADRLARIALAGALDATATERAACMPAAILASHGWTAATLDVVLTSARARYLALTARMVALQEELDWLTYGSYGLIEPLPTVGPDVVEPLAPGHRPFEIVAARADEEADEDEKSTWWSRHGHDKVTEIPARYTEAARARMAARIEAIEGDPRLQLLESFPHKRRWQLPDLGGDGWPATGGRKRTETQQAAEAWLLDRLEDLFAPGGPLATPRPYRLEAIVGALSADARVGAVAAISEATSIFDLHKVAERLLVGQAMPDHDHRIYTPVGLRKRAAWRATWAAQDAEDRGERVEVPLPPKYDKTDFQRSHFALRGKLDVPRERFIQFTDLGSPAWGWNGWRDLARATAQVEALESVRNDPTAPLPTPSHDDPRRCGATLGLWQSLDDVRRWVGPDEASELGDYAAEACGQTRCPCPLVERWQAWTRGEFTPGPRPALVDEIEVSIEEQAAVLEALVLAGKSGLTLSDLGAAAVAVAPARLDAVIDRLVARGELRVSGKGKSARYAKGGV
jgi:hypothetical protein